MANPTPERLRELADWSSDAHIDSGLKEDAEIAAILRSRADEIEAEEKARNREALEDVLDMAGIASAKAALKEQAISDMNSTVRNLQRIADALERIAEVQEGGLQ